jgi:hypothetical protein
MDWCRIDLRNNESGGSWRKCVRRLGIKVVPLDCDEHTSTSTTYALFVSIVVEFKNVLELENVLAGR